jgi:hypothetical protein
VVFGQVQDQAGARDLHVKRRGLVEAMLPVVGEAEEVHIEFPRLGHIEDAHQRGGFQYLQGHGASPALDGAVCRDEGALACQPASARLGE